MSKNENKDKIIHQFLQDNFLRLSLLIIVILIPIGILIGFSGIGGDNPSWWIVDFPIAIIGILIILNIVIDVKRIAIRLENMKVE